MGELSVFCFLLFWLLLAGCAGPRTMLMERVRTDLSASDYQKAYTAYQKSVGQTTDVEQLLNLGLLAFEAGDYATAQKTFEDADRLAEERQTKSLSREAAGIAVSDRVRAYQGTDFDKAMLHYYRALGYIAAGNFADAAVEGRRIAAYLEVLSRDGKHTYRDDAYLQWFNGSLYQGFGQINDAWISYKRSRELYKNYYGVPSPSFLCPLGMQAAQQSGLSETVEELRKECPDTAAIRHRDYGRVVMICETGLAPPIQETNLVFPIFTNDQTSWADDAARERYAYDVYRRGNDYEYDRTKLKYLLRVAMPVYPQYYQGSRVNGIVVRDAQDREYHAELMENVGAVLEQDLKDRYGAIAVRAIIRALIKYAAKEGAEKIGGKNNETLGSILGAVVNAAGVISEAADTRSWETLPDRIYVADFELPPGLHTLRALFEDGTGGTLKRHDFPPVDVKQGQTVFLRVRCTQ
jgi:hypothetical protein